MKITKISIVIEDVDGENASVKLITEPVPQDNEEIEDTPSVLLASGVWGAVQEYLETMESENTVRGFTVQ